MNNYAVFIYDNVAKKDTMCLNTFETLLDAARYYDELLAASKSIGAHAVLRLIGYANNCEDQYTITANEA